MLALWALSLAMTPARAAHELLQLFVTQPYLELHTGPGRGYPVTQVVARGESVDVLFRRTDWFKVRTERGVEGWASARELTLATLADGSRFRSRWATAPASLRIDGRPGCLPATTPAPL